MANLLKFITLLLFLAFFPAVATAVEIDRIAARVNEEIITSYEVDKGVVLLEKEAEKKGQISASDRTSLWKTSLEKLIDKKLIDQKIKDLNINITEEELRQSIEDVKKQNHLSQENLVSALRSQGLSFEQYKSQLREQLERIRLMGQEVRSKIQVGEQEIREYYDANPKIFGGDDFFRASHIFFRLPQQSKPEDVKAVLTKAMIVLQEAKSGHDFAELAKKYSDDPQAAKDGGDLGTFKKGDMLPEIEAAVVGMKVGQISSIVNTPAGFHIIKLEERKAGEVKPFNEVKGAIEEELYRKKSEERFSQWLEELRKGASIEIVR
ncbi:MAG TPA: peptidylprolyl isomerase [Geobacteraceae bacterium]|nr:peptidylprolyl isomerase [Geobacteraceae bacterium]